MNGLDIGWGGVQRWATAEMPPLGNGLHLDVACGYGTFLVQLGWRFPAARLIGLNIDFEGPHSLIGKLLTKAGVRAGLVRADARRMPFKDGTLDSVSCFLGLQDVRIGFGDEGVRASVAEAARVLRPDGSLALMDEFPPERFELLVQGLPLEITRRSERPLDVRWTREVAESSIDLYADGWVVQARAASPDEREKVRKEAEDRMRSDMERQLRSKGYYVPFGPVRIVVARKTR